MSSPAPTFDETLQSITSIKLDEIEKQRIAYQELAAGIFATKATGKFEDKESLLQRVELLVAAVKQWSGAGKLAGTTVGGKLELSNLEFWMKQAREEVGFDLKVVRGWEETLEGHIQHTSRRFDMAKLSGELYLECLASGDSKAPYYGGKEVEEGGIEEVNHDEDFDMLHDAPGGAAKRTQGSGEQATSASERKANLEKEKFVSMVFEEHPVGVSHLFTYLDDLFEPEEAAHALDQVRASIYRFGIDLEAKNIGQQDVSLAIASLLGTGLMSEKQRIAMKQISESGIALEEIARVLNMRMASLETWAWPKEGLKVTMRRHMSDNFRAFSDPEIVDAIFLQHLSFHWKTQLRTACMLFFRSQAWNRSTPSAAQEAAMDKIKQIDHSYNEGPSYVESVDAKRQSMHERVFFLSKLNGADKADLAHNDFVNMNETDTWARDQSWVAAKRKVLHLMATEHRLNHLIHGSHSIIRSTIENFGPSLPHESILIILAFLGVPQKWISFFQAFLAAPMIFQGETIPRMCKRGTPVGYTFSVVFGEAIMFIMDVAVNQRAKGLLLYRMHDDMWLWDADVKKCVKAWKVMNDYAAMVGLDFDDKMTGAVYSGPASADARLLPKGEVKWGLLKFDPTNIKFVIDQDEVDLQIAEFRRRLAATKSVLGWVNIYNKYTVHLSRNFGGMPVNCLGSAFIDDLIKTFKRVQEELFRGSSLGPVGHLRKMVGERFGIHDLPDGYFYFSTAAGGLQLFNPTLMLFALNKSTTTPIFNNFPVPPSGYMGTSRIRVPEVENTPIEMKLMNQFYSDLSDYQALKLRWEQPVRTRQYEVPRHGEFISFQEYISLRESHLATWGKVYGEMFGNPPTKEVALVQIGMNPGCAYFTSKLGRRRPVGVYAKWVQSVYGEDVANKFGSLEIVDQTLILADVVDLFRTVEKKID